MIIRETTIKQTKRKRHKGLMIADVDEMNARLGYQTNVLTRRKDNEEQQRTKGRLGVIACPYPTT